MRFFSPEKALFEVLSGQLAAAGPTVLATALLDASRVYTTDEVPEGFKIEVHLRMIPQPIVVGGVTLEKGKKYDVTYTRRTRTMTLRGWTYQGPHYGDVATFTKGEQGYGARRLFWQGDNIKVVLVG